MRKIYVLSTVFVLVLASFTQLNAQCSGIRYITKMFPADPILTSNIVYGNNINDNGQSESLLLDVYEPQCDVATSRPLVVFAHGGGFVAGDKAGSGYAELCIGLAQLGYVVASINYRLGFQQDLTGFNGAIMRGVHDGRAAVRFMRDNALNGGNTWKIDPNTIFFAGASAGGIMALHIAYQDQQSELTMNCGSTPGSEPNSLEGTSNNLTCSSSIIGMLCISGGIRDLSWIHNNDIPAFLAHGDIDNTVPYGSGSFAGVFHIEGGSTVAQRCNATATPNCFLHMWGQDHFLTNPAYVDTISGIMAQFLHYRTCGVPLDCNFNGLPPDPIPSISVAVTTGGNPICLGSAVTFTAFPVNPGPVTPNYQWTLNGNNVGTNSPTYSSSTLSDADVITCSMNSLCTKPTTVVSPSLTITVIPVVPPTVIASVPASSNPSCPGASVTFTATGTDFGANPIFQWKVNGVNVGGNTVTFTSTTFANNDVVSCTLTSNAPCVNPITVSSAGVTMIINPVGPPLVAITITSGTNPTCAGTPVTFAASSTFGGTSPVYQWMKNGSNTLTGVTYTPATLANGDVVACLVTSNSICASPATAVSLGITMTVNPLVAPSVIIAITPATSSPCLGDAVTFTATPTNGGTLPAYQWQVNGANAGTNSATFTTSTLANLDVVACILTTNVNCKSQPTGTSNPITVTVNPINPAPTVAISLLSGTNPTCASTTVTFTATSTNGGSNPAFQWMVNGVNSATNGIYTTSALINGDVITCIVTSNAACSNTPTATSTGISMVVTPSVAPTVAVAITSGTNTVCIGDAITFTATPSNAGSTPLYQWSVNGNLIPGAQNQTYTPASMLDGDVFYCKITSNANCANPAVITSTGTAITVTAVATVNALSNIDICGGTIGASVFSSTPSGATYTWTNSNTAIGLGASGTGNVPSFSATNSSASPITATIAVTPALNGCMGTPSSYTITVEPTASITQSGSTLTASTGSGYQWYLNGQPVIGATNQTFTFTQQGSYSVAIPGNVCPSQVLTITGVDQVTNDFCFSVFPNPNDGSFFVSFDIPERNTYMLKIIDVVGAAVFEEVLPNFNGTYLKQMNFEGFGKGIYLVSLSDSDNKIVKKIIIY